MVVGGELALTTKVRVEVVVAEFESVAVITIDIPVVTARAPFPAALVNSWLVVLNAENGTNEVTERASSSPSRSTNVS